MESVEVSGEWCVEDVRAVFARRYLHQNRALELFLHDRSEWVYLRVCEGV